MELNITQQVENKLSSIGNILRVANVIYNATINGEKMWQGKIAESLCLDVKPEDIETAIDFLSENDAIKREYGDNGYGQQVVLIAMTKEAVHYFMHLSLAVAPVCEKEHKIKDLFTTKVATPITNIIARARDKCNSILLPKHD